MLLLSPGCATQKPVGVARLLAPPPAQPIRLEPGTIAVISPHTPAGFSFHKAEGKVEHAAHGAGNAADAVLETQTFSHPQAEAVAGAVRFALAPFVAAVAAVNVGSQKLTADKLSQSESDLAAAMAAMADQRHLRDSVLKAATERSGRRFVSGDSMAGTAPDCDPVSAVLETSVEELRLERTGAGDTSFALLVSARARLLRPDDGAILHDQPFQYRSGTALFLDWTLHNAFKNVADTAYRKLAEQIVAQLFPAASEVPVLLGAGHRRSPACVPESPVVLAAHSSTSALRPVVQFVNHPVAASGPIGVYSLATHDHVFIQRPFTKDEAVAAAIGDVEWLLEGGLNSRNSVVQLTAYAASIPMSLGKQTCAAFRGLTGKEYQAANARLSAAAQQIQPHQELAQQVAQQLAPKTSQPVLLARQPIPADDQARFGVMRAMARGGLAAGPKERAASDYLVGHGEDTALFIQVHTAALRGKDGINPCLALCVEARATLWRLSDGEELYSCPVNYRSAERKFTEWAAHDARLFRQELEQSSRELGSAIVDQLVSRGLIAPGRAPLPTLADTFQQDALVP